MNNEIDLDETGEWESGPFCQHWADPTYCDEECRCGHDCRQHINGVCHARGCECEVSEEAIRELPN